MVFEKAGETNYGIFHKPGRGPHAEINITPMIDVLLVLMIIFMVIAPTQSVGLPALVPQPSTSDGHPPDPGKYIVLSIDGQSVLTRSWLLSKTSERA